MLRALDLLCRITTILLGLFMAGMTATMVSLVITRYAFSYSPSWSEEVTRYLMVWMVMLGGAVLVLFDDHITLYMFVEKLNARWRLVQTIIVRLIVTSASAVTAWTGWDFAQSMWVVTAPGTQWPMAIPTFAIPVSFALIVAFSILLLFRDLTALFGKQPIPLPRQSDHMYGSFRPAENSR